MLQEDYESGDHSDWITGTVTSGNTSVDDEYAHEGSSSLRVNIPQGAHHGFGTIYDPVEAGDADSERTEMYAEFWVRFSDDFTADQNVSKLPGIGNFEDGTGHGGQVATGGGWSARVGFSGSGENLNVGAYVYHMDMSGSYGDYFPSGGVNVPRGEWVQIEQFVRLNTVDGGSANSDGILRQWVNGEQVIDRTSMRWTENPDQFGANYRWAVYYGGASPSPQSQYLHLDALRIEADLPDDAGGGGSSSDSSDSGGGGGGGAIQLQEIDVGFDDIPEDLEPPAAKITLDATCDAETLNAVNALRDRDEPMDVAIGQFTHEDMGITDVSWTIDSERSGYDVSITLQEHREVHVGEPGLGGGEDQDSDSEDGADAADYVQDPDQFQDVPDPETDSTVNLGDEGLEPGDEIDPYLEEHLNSGTRVEVPAGDYEWNGGGLGGSYENAELVGVEGDTATDGGDVGIQNHPSHVTFNPGGDSPVHVRVTGGGAGSFHLENIVFTGERSDAGMLVVSVEDSGSSALLQRVYLPDGSSAGSTVGLLVPDSHAGTLHLRNCSVERFSNCGVLARNANGPVHVEGGLYRNNNVADIQFGSDDSTAELVTVVNDEPAPDYSSGGGSQRGVWFARAASNVTVTDCDFYHNVASGTPIEASSNGTISGRVENSRITNDSDRPAAIIRNDVSFTGVHLTGDGNLELMGAQAACAGNEGDCERANYSTNAGDSETEADYDEVVLDAGETRTVTVNSNETLQNVVYDQSADGASVRIVADGNSWRIRNVAVVGQPSGGSTRSVIQASVGSASTARIENVYLADGAPVSGSVAGIRLPESHAGHLTIRNCNIRGFPGHGVHAHRAGAPGAGNGAVDVDGCFLAHNGGANVSLGVNGSSVVNTVIYGDTTAPGDTVIGVWGWYQDAHVTGSHIFVEPTAGPALAGGRYGGSLTMTNGQLSGDTDGDVTLNNVGANPQSEVPSGVPTSPAQAAGQ